MPTTDRDLQALTYLATRLRDETHGCAKWDQAGTYDVFKKELAGWSLAEATRTVLGHACDPAAKTPRAIVRPFVPEVEKSAPKRDPYDPRKVCHTCGKGPLRHPGHDGHHFLSVEAARAVPSSPAPESVRNAIAPGPRGWTGGVVGEGSGT